MKTNRNIILGLATAVSLLFGSVAMAGPPSHAGGPGGPGGFLRPIAIAVRVLDLTEEQEAMVEEFKSDMEENKAAMEESREQSKELFKTELTSRNPNARKLHDQIDADMEMISDFRHNQLDQLLAFHDTLTDAGTDRKRRCPLASDRGCHRLLQEVDLSRVLYQPELGQLAAQVPDCKAAHSFSQACHESRGGLEHLAGGNRRVDRPQRCVGLCQPPMEPTLEARDRPNPGVQHDLRWSD